MKNNYKRISALFVCLMVLVSCFATTASAASSSATATSFTSDWERYKTVDGGKGVLTYGFNTFMFNEDYAKANHDDQPHYCALYNGNGWATANVVAAGKVTMVEAVHAGTSVSYYIYY